MESRRRALIADLCIVGADVTDAERDVFPQYTADELLQLRRERSVSQGDSAGTAARVRSGSDAERKSVASTPPHAPLGSTPGKSATSAEKTVGSAEKKSSSLKQALQQHGMLVVVGTVN